MKLRENNENEERSKDVLREEMLGELLLNSGKITRADIAKVLVFQKKSGLYFGEAVIKLKLASKEDVELAIARQFDHPYLSKADNTISKEVAAAYHPFSSKVEAVKKVRTSLLLSGAVKNLKTICITACENPDKKTSFGADLAVVLAQLGHKTLFMDFDLRTPKVHQLFRVKNSSGVSTLLVDRSTSEEAIQPTPFEKLSILPSGPLPPNPLELITRKEGVRLMATLKDLYEIIIVNTPLLNNTVADTSFLASFMDGVVIVATDRKTRKTDLRNAKKLLEESGALVLGVVLNQ